MGPDQRQQAVGLGPGAEQRLQQRLQHGTPAHGPGRTKTAIAIWSEHAAAVGHGIDQLRHELAQPGRESQSVAMWRLHATLGLARPTSHPPLLVGDAKAWAGLSACS